MEINHAVRFCNRYRVNPNIFNEIFYVYHKGTDYVSFNLAIDHPEDEIKEVLTEFIYVLRKMHIEGELDLKDQVCENYLAINISKGDDFKSYENMNDFNINRGSSEYPFVINASITFNG